MTAMFSAERVKRDTYNGVQLKLREDECTVDVADFERALDDFLETCKNRGVRGVWLQIPVQGAKYVESTVRRKFTYHHARPQYLMCTLWLPEGPSRLPETSHHQVGVGGMCLNHDGTKILVIQEKTGSSARRQDFWKLPGGLVDRGEDMHKAVVREVFEETGIRTRFAAIASFRESHEAPFGNTDIYFVCVVRLDTRHHAPPSDPVPVPCELEVNRAVWMPVEEFLSGKLYKIGLLRDLMKSAIDVARGANSNLGFNQENLQFWGGRFVSAYRPQLSQL